jgi:RNA polymerase sigma factor (sigma-70 family)
MWQRVVEGPLPDVTQTPDQEHLTRIYDAHARSVYSYALRHVGSSDADDVLSETFAVAWRRRDSLPTDPVGWLLVTARNIISDRYRADQRRARLTDVMSDELIINRSRTDEDILQRLLVIEALDALSLREREALLLVSWDGLNNVEAAAVAKCSPRAFRARLMRARIHLAAAMLPPQISNRSKQAHQP